MKRIAYIILLFLYLLLVNIVGRAAFLYYNRDLSFFNMADGVKREITEDDAYSRVQDFEARVQMPRADELQMIVTKAQ